MDFPHNMYIHLFFLYEKSPINNIPWADENNLKEAYCHRWQWGRIDLDRFIPRFSKKFTITAKRKERKITFAWGS